jgi:sulfopyruvate decarboxylase subunit alpha
VLLVEINIEEAILMGLKQAGIDFVASLPSSTLVPVLKKIEKDTDFVHVPVSHEADAIGICAGAWLGGMRPAFLCINEGLMMATYPLLSTVNNFGGFPLLLVVDHRGEFGDRYPWYFACGTHLPKILDSFQILYTRVWAREKITSEIVRGQHTARANRKPAAILLCGEDIYAMH